MFGAGNDLLIKHNGTNNVIQSVTGDLKIGVSNTFAVQNDTFDENMITATEDGKVELYYNGSKKFETTSGGATLTGAVTVSGGSENLLGNFVSTDSIAEIRIQDNSKYTRLLTVGTQFKIMPNDGSETLILDGNNDSATFAGSITATGGGTFNDPVTITGPATASTNGSTRIKI